MLQLAVCRSTDQISTSLSCSYATVQKDINLRFEALKRQVRDNVQLGFSKDRQEVRSDLNLWPQRTLLRIRHKSITPSTVGDNKKFPHRTPMPPIPHTIWNQAEKHILRNHPPRASGATYGKLRKDCKLLLIATSDSSKKTVDYQLPPLAASP